MKKFALIFMSVAVLLSAPGCKKPEKDKAPAPQRLVIAVIPKGTTHEFWKTVHAGAERAGKELDVDVIWKGPLKEDDRESQIKIVEDFIIQKVDGIVLAPLDNLALAMPVSNAVRSGVPVVIIDSGLKGEDYISFVATDNHLAGMMAGERMKELLPGGGKVVMLRYQEGSASTMERERGFLDALSGAGTIAVVSQNQYGGPTTETAYRASENLLAPFKQEDGALEIAGIFCPNESTTFGMLRAIQDAGAAGKVKFVGFDSSPKLAEALAAGHINGLVLQDPDNMGYQGVRTMVMHVKGQAAPPRIDTGATLATPENMNDPAIKKLF